MHPKTPEEIEYDKLKPITVHPVNFDSKKPYLTWVIPHKILDILVLPVSQVVCNLKMGHGIKDGDNCLLFKNINQGDAVTPEEWAKKNKRLIDDNIENMFPVLNRQLTIHEQSDTPWALKIRLSNEPNAEVFEIQGNTLKQIQDILKAL